MAGCREEGELITSVVAYIDGTLPQARIQSVGVADLAKLLSRTRTAREKLADAAPSAGTWWPSATPLLLAALNPHDIESKDWMRTGLSLYGMSFFLVYLKNIQLK